MRYPSYEDAYKIRLHLREISIKHWRQDDLLSWQWWFLLVSALLPWWIWHKLVSKERYLEILTFALITAVISATLDVIGSDLGFWGYPNKLVLFVPPLFPADLTFFPVSFSLLYQYTHSWKQYLFASFLFSFFISYGIEPAFIKMGLYKNHYFPHWASLIGFFLLSIVLRWITRYIILKSQKQ